MADFGSSLNNYLKKVYSDQIEWCHLPFQVPNFVLTKLQIVTELCLSHLKE